MKKTMLATILMMSGLALTPVTASAKSQPALTSKHWQTSRIVKVTRSVKGIERGATLKNKQLTLTNQTKKTATIKKGTEIGVRYMGHGYWQIAGKNYPASKAGVWLVNQNSTHWFSQVQTPKALPKKWNTQHFVTTTSAVQAQQMQVTTKNKQLTITNKVLKTTDVKVGTQAYVRNMGNGVWQIANNDFPSNKTGVWIVRNATTNWFKVTKAPVAKTYQLEPSRYQIATSNTLNLNSTTATDVYAPYGFKPLSFTGGFNINPGQKVSVTDDTANNRYIITDNNQNYALAKNDQYQFSTANAQKVGSTGNNIESTYAPYDTNAIVPNGYQPTAGNLWIQVNPDGSVNQYYFYTTQNNQSGWAKAKSQTQNGQTTIVPE